MVSQIVQTKLVIQAVSRGFKDVDKQLESINKRLGLTEKAGRQGGKGIGALGSAFGGLGSILATLGLGLTIKQLGEFAFESTMLAARVETLGIVTQTLGANAGYTTSEIDALERAIQKEGITTQASRQSLALMMQAQLDLADSTDLARLAQDAAVIAGVNSSEAFQRLINVITTGNVRMARTMGLQVNFNQGYEDLAIRLGITADELTATEKAQERTNIVMAEGAQIAGAYDAAMGSVGKQVTSTPRYWEEFKVAFGKANIETVGKANTAWQGWLKTQTTAMNAVTATTEAEEMGIITSEQAAEVRYRLMQGDMEYADALAWLSQEMDTYTVAIEQAILADSIMLGIQEDMSPAVDDVSASYNNAIKALDGFSTSAIGATAISQILSGYMDDGFISDKEKQDIIDYAEAWGITLPASFTDAVNNFNAMQGDMEEGIDVLITKAAEYAAKLRNASLYKADYSLGADQAGKWTPTGYTPHAKGGKLGGGVSMVGEEGFELVINNTVIPHEESKRLMSLGLVPGQSFASGGRLNPMLEGGLGAPIWGYDKYMSGADRPIRYMTGGYYPQYSKYATDGGKKGDKEGSMQINNTIAALSGAVTSSVAASVAQSQLVAERISTSTTREISRGNQEVADLMRINNALLARLATAEEIVNGISGAVGELM